MGREIRTAVLAWVGLMVLLALTVGVTLAPLDGWRMPLSLFIAAVKAGLIFWFFMHLREEKGLVRVFALAAIVWLALLLLLSAADFASRGGFGAGP